MNLDDETFEQWIAEKAQHDPILARAVNVKINYGLSDIEFCRQLVYWQQGALEKSQEAFREHLEKCTMPHKVQLNN